MSAGTNGISTATVPEPSPTAEIASAAAVPTATDEAASARTWGTQMPSRSSWGVSPGRPTKNASSGRPRG